MSESRDKCSAEAVDFDRFRLRRFVESLGDAELETRSEPIDLAGIAEMMEGNARRCCSAPPVRRRRNWSATSWAAARGSRPRFGETPSTLLKEIQRRLNKPEIFEVSRAEAPCQAVVLTGDDADLTKLPVHLQHGADGAPYISVVDRLRHRSEDRLHQRRPAPPDAALRHETGIDLVAPSDLHAIYEANAAQGKPRRSASWSARIRSIMSPA